MAQKEVEDQVAAFRSAVAPDQYSPTDFLPLDEIDAFLETLGDPINALQAAGLHSPKWYPFGEATTNRNGAFRAHYRFDATRETTIYKIRAVAPHQHGWPWEAGHSKPVLVEVRG